MKYFCPFSKIAQIVARGFFKSHHKLANLVTLAFVTGPQMQSFQQTFLLSKDYQPLKSKFRKQFFKLHFLIKRR